VDWNCFTASTVKSWTAIVYISPAATAVSLFLINDPAMMYPMRRIGSSADTTTMIEKPIISLMYFFIHLLELLSILSTPSSTFDTL